MAPASAIRPVFLLALLSLAACDDRHWPSGYSFPNQPYSGNGSIQQPTTINLHPSQDSDRLYVMVTAVGSQAVSMPLAFDTGSAGITLYAPAMSFPSSMLNSNGFIFPEGQNTIVYNGIAVANLAATRQYGSPTSGTTENGNIGCAQVTFGDADGQLTTDVMTVFLKHLHYAPWINPGFSLSPSLLQDCDITRKGKCTPVPMLTIGLTGEIESGFSQVTLTCPQPNYLGPDTIDGYLGCGDQIPFTTIEVTLPTKPTVTLTESVLFDSGNQAVNIAQSSGSLPATLLSNTTISIVAPSGFTYSYTAESSGDTETTIATGGSAGIGVYFFTEHYFFIDFATNIEGWM